MKRYFIIAFAIVLLFLAHIGWDWYQFISTPMTTQPVNFMVKPGATIRQLTQQLVKDGYIDSPRYFSWLVRYKKAATKIKAGEYRIDAQTTPEIFLDKVIRGEVVLHKITLVSGWTFKQDMNVINNDPFLDHTLKGLSAQQIMAKLGHPGEHPEGRFFPNTYLFARGIKDTKILTMSYDAMKKRLTKLWAGRAQGLPYQSVYQGLIVASMIQKETFIEKERPEIAGVILRRLKIGMRLQIDPTVIYGLGDRYKGQLTRKDMRFKSPYNTYLNKGLPPTPICMPNAYSLAAAFHPAKGDALYYVLSAKGDGTHIFSKTYTKHKTAVTKYWTEQDKIKREEAKQAKVIQKEAASFQQLYHFALMHYHKLHIATPTLPTLITTAARLSQGVMSYSVKPLLIYKKCFFNHEKNS